MIFNPLFFSLINSNSTTRFTTKNINDITNSFPAGIYPLALPSLWDGKSKPESKLEGEFPEEKISKGFFQKIPKYLFSDIMNVLLVRESNIDVHSDKDGFTSHIPSREIQQNENDVKINPSANREKISNKMDLVYSFINDFSLQDVFGSKVEEIKSKLLESHIVVNYQIPSENFHNSAEILIDENVLKGFVEKLISNQSNEVKVLLNKDESIDNANTIESNSSKNSVDEENKISGEEKNSVNITSKQEPDLFALFNLNPFSQRLMSLWLIEKNFLPSNLIDIFKGGKIIIENKSFQSNSAFGGQRLTLRNEPMAQDNENKLVIEIESSEENNLNNGNQIKLKMNIVTNKNYETNLMNTDDELTNYSDYEKIEKLQSNSKKYFSGIDVFPKSSSDYQVKIILNNALEKTNSFIQLDKNNLSNEIKKFISQRLTSLWPELSPDEILNSSKKLTSENENESKTFPEGMDSQIIPDETEISNKGVNKNKFENIKFFTNEIYDNKIYSASKYIKKFNSINDLDIKSKTTEKLNFENENILHRIEEKDIPLKIISQRLTEIKKDEDLNIINKNSEIHRFGKKHQQNNNNKFESEKIIVHKNDFENVKKENINTESNKINIKVDIVNEKEQTNYLQDDKRPPKADILWHSHPYGTGNDTNNNDSKSKNDFKQNIKNENDENGKIDFNLKENASSPEGIDFQETHSEKITNQIKTDFISNVNGKEILNSEINNLQKAEVNLKYFNSEKIIEISELFKEVSSLISKKENGIIKLQIKPESLGKILITIDSAKEIVNARIEVENKSVQALLENNINQLYSNINQNGVQLSSVQIFLNQGESKNYRPNYSKKKSYEENNNRLNEDEEKITSRKLGYNTYEYLI